MSPNPYESPTWKNLQRTMRKLHSQGHALNRCRICGRWTRNGRCRMVFQAEPGVWEHA